MGIDFERIACGTIFAWLIFIVWYFIKDKWFYKDPDIEKAKRLLIRKHEYNQITKQAEIKSKQILCEHENTIEPVKGYIGCEDCGLCIR